MTKKLKLRDCLNESLTSNLLNGIKTFKDGPAYARGWDGKVLYEMDDDGNPVNKDTEKPKKKLLLQTDDEESKGVTKEMKKAFREAVSDFNKYGESVYRDGNLKEICKEILQIGKLAEQIALEETDDWSDTATVQKDFKNLNENCKLFEKTAKEVSVLQRRLESCFEAIGSSLGRYFEIKDIENELNKEDK